jgi:hypothetical protein
MQWPPKYKRIVLSAGDQYSIHRSGKGGLKIGPAQLQISEEGMPLEDDLRLGHWKGWFDSKDADKWRLEDQQISSKPVHLAILGPARADSRVDRASMVTSAVNR